MKEIWHFEVLAKIRLLTTFFEIGNKFWFYVNDHSVRSEIYQSVLS